MSIFDIPPARSSLFGRLHKVYGVNFCQNKNQIRNLSIQNQKRYHCAKIRYGYLRELVRLAFGYIFWVYVPESVKKSQKGQRIVLACSITCIAGQSGSKSELYAQTGFSVAVTVTEMIFITRITVSQQFHKERQIKRN